MELVRLPYRNAAVGGEDSKRFGFNEPTTIPTMLNSTNPQAGRRTPPPPPSVPPGEGGLVRCPTKSDVLCGRSELVRGHRGNARFRKLVRENRRTYIAETTSKIDKAHIAADIVRTVREWLPPGRFLKVDERSGQWFDIGDENARKKAGQALREDNPRRKVERNEGRQENEVQAWAEKWYPKPFPDDYNYYGPTPSNAYNANVPYSYYPPPNQNVPHANVPHYPSPDQSVPPFNYAPHYYPHPDYYHYYNQHPPQQQPVHNLNAPPPSKTVPIEPGSLCNGADTNMGNGLKTANPETLRTLLSHMDKNTLQRLQASLNSSVKTNDSALQSAKSGPVARPSWDQKMSPGVFNEVQVKNARDKSIAERVEPPRSDGNSNVNTATKRSSWVGEMPSDANNNNNNNNGPQQQENRLSDSQTTIKQSGNGSNTSPSWNSSRTWIETKKSDDDGGKAGGPATEKPALRSSTNVVPPPPPKPPVPNRARWRKEAFAAKQWKIKNANQNLNNNNNNNNNNNANNGSNDHGCVPPPLTRRKSSVTDSTSSDGAEFVKNYETNRRSARFNGIHTTWAHESTRSIISDLSSEILSLDLQEQWQEQQKQYAEALRQHQAYLAQMRLQNGTDQ